MDLKRLIPFSLSLISRISPELAARLAGELFCRAQRIPRSRKESLFWETGTNIPLKSGRIAKSWGSGPRVYFIHGWEGRGSQFYEMVPTIVQNGFEAVLWDGPAHGDSPGKKTHILHFASSFVEDFSAQNEPLFALVGHSFGGASFALIPHLGLKPAGIVTLASPSRIQGVFDRYTDLIQLSPAAKVAFQAYLEKQVNMSIESGSLISHDLSKIAQTMIIHDVEDKEVPFSDFEELKKKWSGGKFYKTIGLGHRRILRDEETAHRVVDFLNQIKSKVPILIIASFISIHLALPKHSFAVHKRKHSEPSHRKVHVKRTREVALATALREAALTGDVNAVTHLLAEGAKYQINHPDELQETALHCASYDGHTSIAQLLLAEGAHVDAVNQDLDTPLTIASFFEGTSLVALLIQHHANVNHLNREGHSALYLAAKEGNPEIVSLLLAAGASPDILSPTDHHSPLTIAAKEDFTEIVRILLDHGASIQHSTKTQENALFYAIENENNDLITLLIERGIHVNKIDQYKNSCLLAALGKQNLHAIQLILKAGVENINQVNNRGQTALSVAAYHSLIPIVKQLLEIGANSNDYFGPPYTPESALKVATENLDRDMIEALFSGPSYPGPKGILAACMSASNNNRFDLVHLIKTLEYKIKRRMIEEVLIPELASLVNEYSQ